ncbi:hypothetical protein KHP62_12785 [Rhodobacteraceae bacterium NNCM2]|nr:hypothetical protein [Coraliihabitans acroporae]
MQQALNKLALHWGRRVLSRFVRDDPGSEVPLTVMMPLAPKDIARARVSIPQIREMVAHPIERFAVVAPEDGEIRALCRRLSLDFIEETEPLTDLLGADRLGEMKGWYRQQFLKLFAPEVMGGDRVLTFDSDTYPLRPTAFVDPAGKTILYRGDRNMAPFHQFTRRLIGPTPAPRTSFVAHCMVFEREPLRALRRAIQEHMGKPWLDATLDLIGDESAGVLSEFDLYGHFMLREMPDRITTRYYANIKVPADQFAGEAPIPDWKRRFRFVSNHAHVA